MHKVLKASTALLGSQVRATVGFRKGGVCRRTLIAFFLDQSKIFEFELLFCLKGIVVDIVIFFFLIYNLLKSFYETEDS